MIQTETQGAVPISAPDFPDLAQAVSLSGIQNIRTAGQTRSSLLQALEGESALRIDLSAIEEADVGLLQVLIAMQHSAHLNSRAVEFVGAPEGVVRQLMEDAGALPANSGSATPDPNAWVFSEGIST